MLWTKLRALVRSEKEVLIAVITTRLLVCVVGWFAYEAVPHTSEHGISGTAPWHFLFRWDAVHYYEIATSGYEQKPVVPTTPFFPLLPLLLRLFVFVTRGDPAIVGFFLCNALFLTAALLLRRLLALDYPPPSRVPERSVWLLCVGPMTFFFSAIYTESLFLLLAVAVLWLARERRWLACAMVGALATATRPNAVLLLVPLVAEAISGWRNANRARPFWLLLVPVGFVSYAVYLQMRFGDALAFWHGQETFSREALTPWRAFAATFDYPPPDAALFIATAVGAIGLCVVAGKKLRLSYALFACAMTIVCMSSTWYALPRYLTVVFPFYAAVAVMTERSESAFVAVTATSAAVMAVCLALFVTGYPII